MYIKVKVFTNQKKEHIARLQEDTFEISVKEKPERNKANIRVRELLAEALSIPMPRIQIVTGHKRPNKILFTSDL